MNPSDKRTHMFEKKYIGIKTDVRYMSCGKQPERQKKQKTIKKYTNIST